MVKKNAMPAGTGKRFRTALAGDMLWISDHKLGAGGQAAIYKGTLNGREVAVKDFHPEYATSAMQDQLEKVILMGPPDERFAWPFDFVSYPKGGLAAVMPLIPDTFRSIPDLLFDRVRPSFRALATVCFELSDAFHRLHARGICYKDVNSNNVLFCPTTGAVRICDNENAAYDGTEHSAVATPGYTAPELGRGETPCTIVTDRYSLGVLLFELLCIAHPLRGKRESAIVCLGAEDEYYLFCEKPVFVFDPKDASNRPNPKVHKNVITYWPLYPTCLRSLFVRHFTQGLVHPETQRVLESEFRKAFVELHDSIFLCSSCQAEVFFDAATSDRKCWKCKRRLASPLRLRFKNKHQVVLHGSTVLFLHHLAAAEQYNFTKPQSKVVIDPKTRRAGLTNLSAQKWVVHRADKPLVDALPGETVLLSRGTRIYFPGDEGEVVG